MFATIVTSLVLKTGFSPRVVKAALLALAVATAIGLAVLAWNLWLSDHDEDVIASHEQGVELDLQKQGRAADQNLAERAADGLREQQQAREEFDNATAHLPKSGLTDRQRIDACNELRAQGEPPAILAVAKCL